MQHTYWLLFIIGSTLQLESTDDNSVVLNLQGIVGGSVRMQCVLEHSHSITQLYFQKTESDGKAVFVNGFYSKSLSVMPQYQNRTIVNRTELSMELLDLSPADEGEYTCIPFIESIPSKINKFFLTITATYRTPVITSQGCDSPTAYNCLIECSSSGGFPLSTVTWDVVGDDTGSPLMYEMDPVFTQDVHSHLWNVSQNFSLTCTRPLQIACSVGGVESPEVSVCDF